MKFSVLCALTLASVVDGSLLRSNTRRLDEVVDMLYFDDTYKVLAASVADLQLSAGQDNSYDFTLYKEWTRKTVIGSATYKCTNTKTMYEAFCNGHVQIDGDDATKAGSLELQGIVSVNSEDNQLLAIVGGTGLYVGARGQVVGTKQTAQGGIKNQATFSVWSTSQSGGTSNDEATVVPASVTPVANSTLTKTTSTKANTTKASKPSS